MIFDPGAPTPGVQRDRWSCFANSLAWSLSAMGVVVPTRTLVRTYNITTPRGYLVDKSGHDLGHFIAEQTPLAGLYVPDVTFDQVAVEAGRYGLVLGGSIFLHYVAVRGYDPARDVLLLVNTAPGWAGVGQAMTRRRFDRLRPLSLTRLAPDATIEAIAERHRHVRPY